MNRKGLGVGAIIAIPVLVLAGIFSFMLLATAASANCNPTGRDSNSVTVDPSSVPDTSIAGYNHEQLVNAAYVIEAGKALNLSARDQTIGVMTAMGESSLRVVDYGDTAGPDSRGLFQQRDNGAWGSYEDRMDPFISSTNFFKKLATIPARDSLAPTIVAHRVQVNADPYHYEKFWHAAVAVVDGLTGVKTGLNPGTGGQVCSSTPLGNGQVSAQGWALPAAGPIASPFGYRVHPIYGTVRLHAGVDIGAGCDDPIYAAQAGTVVATGFNTGYGANGTIIIDHGGGVQTVYLHMYQSGILVQDGQKVVAGQQIGLVGSSGDSTGCHLHLQVMINDSPTDPVPFMQAVGVTIGG